MRDLDLDIRAIQLSLLDRLLSVCQAHNLRVWADAGTLLGAIRHKGFIPWDDDIDMAMMREDYDRLVSIASEVFKPPYFFQTAYSEAAPYPRGHAQLRMDGTAAILPYDIDQDFHQGVFIDIFPYDAIPDDLAERLELIHARDQMMSKMYEYAYGRPRLLDHSFNKHLRHNRRIIDTIGFKSFFSDFENLFRAIRTQADSICCLSFSTDLDRFQRNKGLYDETLYVPFENTTIPIPSGYDQILTKMYGDYMTPVKAPTIHGGFLVLDPDKSYTEYLPALRQEKKKQIRKERVSRVFKKIF